MPIASIAQQEGEPPTCCSNPLLGWSADFLRCRRAGQETRVPEEIPILETEMALFSKDMIWILLGAALALLLWRRFTASRNKAMSGAMDVIQDDARAASDPVTGNKVDPTHAITTIFEGKTFFFESESSRTVFQQNPAKFAHQHRGHHGSC